MFTCELKNKNTNRLLWLLSIVMITAITGISVIGCPGPSKISQEDKSDAAKPQIGKFSWDTTRHQSRWTKDSPIGWLKTNDKDEVINASRSSGKPILAYVSRYDSPLTASIEETVLKGDTWGTLIKEHFIPWKVDWWENPAQALEILFIDPAPALVILKPSPDTSSSELRRLDIWTKEDVLAFPLHNTFMPVGDAAALDKLASYAKIDFASLENPKVMGAQVDANGFVSIKLKLARAKLGLGKNILPEEALLLTFEQLVSGTREEKLGPAIHKWAMKIPDYGVASVWLPDEAFSPGSGWAIDPVRNIKGLTCGIGYGADLPIPAQVLSEKIGGLLGAFEGDPGGGFPAFIDIRNTFHDNISYLTDAPELPPDIIRPFQNMVLGPRDIVWTNAKMLAWWLRVNKWNKELFDLGKEDNRVAMGKIPLIALELMAAILDKAGDVTKMTFPEKVYILDALNEMYQFTGDVDYLNKAGEIAACFPSENPESWFNPVMFPLLPDLAMALHFYGWLAESEDARKSARYITQHAVQYAASYPEIDGTWLAYAHRVVNQKCIHAAVMAKSGNQKVRECLTAALQGWDPRKIAQFLDVERDAKLIEKKGYITDAELAVFICIDDACYPPVSEAAKVTETLKTVMSDLMEEALNQAKGSKEN